MSYILVIVLFLLFWILIRYRKLRDRIIVLEAALTETLLILSVHMGRSEHDPDLESTKELDKWLPKVKH